ncbi:hypothetical protein KQI88_08925 [Alkaliphilus sp. MSJ-5]|uniref:ComK protein n=1 Tax=Alkaliphilus flagellatus TaxID=2841507 RepID=A0ABS6G237_9FIRM|nr:hypothetical protein [Alkaliphilus flagellatus]MBU5676538.1 hypothetical protein [Alkaliphilus flagellatus]
MKRLNEILKEQEKIACMLAVYEKNMGNCTKMIFQNGREMLLKQSVDSTLQAILKYHTIDLKELRKKQQKLLNSRYYIPLPINKDMLFISIKTRLPKVKKDSSVSYINFYEIDRLDRKNSIIYMKNGYNIESLNSITTLKKRYHQGEISAKLQNSQQKHNLIVEEEIVPYFYPATKGDINAISREIESLRDMLKDVLVEKNG